MSQSQGPSTRGTRATATSSATSPGTPPRHGSSGDDGDGDGRLSSRDVPGDDEPTSPTSRDGDVSSSVSSRGCANGRPSAVRWAPAAGPVVSGLLTRMGGSRMASRPKMLPRNSASKSRAHAPVSGSSHPSRRSGWMSMRTPGGGGGRRPWSCARTRAGPRTCARRRRGGPRPGARDPARRRRRASSRRRRRSRSPATRRRRGWGATRASSSGRRATPATRPSPGAREGARRASRWRARG